MMSYTNPLLNALLAALLGVFFIVYWVWDNPRDHIWLMVIVAAACAILGYTYGEPFIAFIRHLLPGHGRA